MQEKKLCDWPQNAHCTEETDTNELDPDPRPESESNPWDRPPQSATVQPPQWTPPSTTEWTWTPPSSTESSEGETYLNTYQDR